VGMDRGFALQVCQDVVELANRVVALLRRGADRVLDDRVPRIERDDVVGGAAAAQLDVLLDHIADLPCHGNSCRNETCSSSARYQPAGPAEAGTDLPLHPTRWDTVTAGAIPSAPGAGERL